MPDVQRRRAKSSGIQDRPISISPEKAVGRMLSEIIALTREGRCFSRNPYKPSPTKNTDKGAAEIRFDKRVAYYSCIREDKTLIAFLNDLVKIAPLEFAPVCKNPNERWERPEYGPAPFELFIEDFRHAVQRLDFDTFPRPNIASIKKLQKQAAKVTRQAATTRRQLLEIMYPPPQKPPVGFVDLPLVSAATSALVASSQLVKELEAVEKATSSSQALHHLIPTDGSKNFSKFAEKYLGKMKIEISPLRGVSFNDNRIRPKPTSKATPLRFTANALIALRIENTLSEKNLFRTLKSKSFEEKLLKAVGNGRPRSEWKPFSNWKAFGAADELAVE